MDICCFFLTCFPLPSFNQWQNIHPYSEFLILWFNHGVASILILEACCASFLRLCYKIEIDPHHTFSLIQPLPSMVQLWQQNSAPYSQTPRHSTAPVFPKPRILAVSVQLSTEYPSTDYSDTAVPVSECCLGNHPLVLSSITRAAHCCQVSCPVAEPVSSVWWYSPA